MSVWKTGSTGRITFTFTNADGVATNATVATIIIYSRPALATVLASTNILPNTTGTGVYYHDWTPATAGDYICVATATVSSVTEIGSVRFLVTSPTDIPIT